MPMAAWTLDVSESDVEVSVSGAEAAAEGVVDVNWEDWTEEVSELSARVERVDDELDGVVTVPATGSPTSEVKIMLPVLESEFMSLLCHINTIPQADTTSAGTICS